MMHRQQFFHWYYQEKSQPVEKYITPMLKLELTDSYHEIVIAREASLNTFNLEILEGLKKILTQTKESPQLLMLSGEKKVLSAGDDYVGIFYSPRSISDYLAYKFQSWHLLKCRQNSLCFMQGSVMGSGLGLALSCNLRVATPSTVVQLPENSLGLIPDPSALYFLSTHSNQPLGLYLALSGATLKGSDLYLYGFATHFMSDEMVNRAVTSIKGGHSLSVVLDKLCTVPSVSQSSLEPAMSEIKEVFGNYTSLQDIYQRLASRSTDFSKQTLMLLKPLCPLSLRMTTKAFFNFSKLTFEEALCKGYDLLCQLIIHRSYNFSIAVNHKLLYKSKSPMPWSPDDISTITPQILAPFFNNSEGPHLEV
mgnify:FL=1